MAFEAQEALKVGDLGQCEKLLMEAVRAKPGAVELRAFLAQLSLIMGRWQRAENQFKLLGELSPEAKQVSDAYRAAAAAEVMRADVFAGKTRPIIFGTPPARTGQNLARIGQKKFPDGQNVKTNVQFSPPDWR